MCIRGARFPAPSQEVSRVVGSPSPSRAFPLESHLLQISGALDSHRSSNLTVNRICRGSGLHPPCENPVPETPKWMEARQ